MNLWLASFIVAWIIFIILIDYRKIIPNIFVGITALTFQIVVDSTAGFLGLYKINIPLIQICHSSVFFTYGPVLTMGTLFSQYYPKENHIKVINIFAWSFFFILLEIVLNMNNYVVYTNWNIFYSIMINLGVTTILSYICELIIYTDSFKRRA